MQALINKNNSLEELLIKYPIKEFSHMMDEVVTKLHLAFHKKCPWNIYWLKNGPFRSEETNADNPDLYGVSKKCVYYLDKYFGSNTNDIRIDEQIKY